MDENTLTDVLEEVVDLPPEQEESETIGADEEEQEMDAGGEVVSPEPEPDKQTPQENAAYKAIRRRAEEQARAEAQIRIDRMYAQQYAGQINPYTGKPIASEADFKAYQQEHERVQQESALKNAGISREVLESLISEHPTVKQAESVIEQMNQERGNAALKEKVAEIGKLNPNIKSIEDLMKIPGIEQFNELVMKGYDMVDAYKLISFEASTEKAASAARTETIKKLQANAGATPGALGSAQPGGEKNFATMSDAEFDKYLEAAKRGELAAR